MEELLKKAKVGRNLVDEALDLIKTTYNKRAEEIRAKQDAKGPLALLIFTGEDASSDQNFCLESAYACGGGGNLRSCV